MQHIMAYRFFAIPIRDEGSAAAELNGFLRSHRVLAVDRRWVEQGSESFWSFCVDYLESAGVRHRRAGQERRWAVRRWITGRYSSPEDFAVFARLRQVRKEIAQAEAVPVYTIFTNEQLAQMVQARATTKAALEKIAGVGDARIEKYGARMLEVLRRQWGEDRERARMRRANNLFERIVDRDNLRLAVHKALRGKRSTPDARAFVARPGSSTSNVMRTELFERRRSRWAITTSSRSSTPRSG